MPKKVTLATLSTSSMLTTALELSQVSKSQFARNAGLNPSDLIRYLHGDHEMGIKKAAKVLADNGLAFEGSVRVCRATKNTNR